MTQAPTATRAPADTVCGCRECVQPAVVELMLVEGGAKHLRCAACWPALEKVLRERGHELRF